MRKRGIVLIVVACLALGGCASAPAEPDRQEVVSDLLKASSAIQSGDAIADAYDARGIFDGIAKDLVDGCEKVGMPQAYASQIPDMEDAIIQAYEVACP